MSSPLVSFMMIGAQKSGTTSLAAHLDAHPEICIADDKEPQFFNEVTDWRSQVDEYHAGFHPIAGQRCGDCSTTYTFLPEFTGTAQRVHEYNPGCRLIYVMRQPVERMLSNYAHRAARAITDRDVVTDLQTDATYVNRSRYAVQLRPWIDLFGRDAILLLTMEEYLDDTADTLRRIADHIDVDPDAFPASDAGRDVEPVVLHRSTGASHLRPRAKAFKQHPLVQKALPLVPEILRRRIGGSLRVTLEEKPRIPDDLRAALWALVADDVAQVETWMGRPITEWERPT